jgi:glycosyltransferase involved in cell wall biosynthesis
MPSPLISIVIPVYNGSDYAACAIDSALGQTYGNFEVIVVNDGSTDGGKTKQIIDSYGDRVRAFDKPNGGVASALNLAIGQMRGEYFSWLSHDDVYLPHKLQSQVDFLKNQPELAVVYCDYEEIDGKGRHKFYARSRTVAPVFFRPALIAGLSLRGFHGCGMLIHREVFLRYGLFSERLRYTQDYDRWFAFAAHVPFVHQPEVLIQARMHANQGSVRMDTRIEEYRLFQNAIEGLTEAELAYDGTAHDTLMKLALALSRSPKRCSSAPLARERAGRYPAVFSGRRMTRELLYRLHMLRQRLSGNLLDPSDIDKAQKS